MKNMRMLIPAMRTNIGEVIISIALIILTVKGFLCYGFIDTLIPIMGTLFVVLIATVKMIVTDYRERLQKDEGE